jgi:CxxC motif-containing protein (DUF1111 family)
MNRTYRLWYLLFLLLAVIPAGARLWQWQKTRTRAVDQEMAQAGKVLFEHEWVANDPLCPEGDGLGPVYNARSCVACHNQGGPGGGGGLEHNVTTFTVQKDGQEPREGVVHAFGLDRTETLKDIHPDLPAISRPTLDQVVNLPGRRGGHCLQFPKGVHVSQRNTPALFGAKLIDDIPERAIIANAKAQRARWGMAPPDDDGAPVGRAVRLADGRIGRFGWKAQTASLSDFVRAACANELGLGNPTQKQPKPIYENALMASSASFTPTTRKGMDLTDRQCNELTAFCSSLPRPVERRPADISEEQAADGKQLFNKIGCAECHTQKLGSVDGIYSDLLLHRMGANLVGGGSYNEQPMGRSESAEPPSPDEWRTPPLWGVADSAPYLHDGRASTLKEAIEMHAGQAARSASDFARLSRSEQTQLIDFLRTLRAP